LIIHFLGTQARGLGANSYAVKIHMRQAQKSNTLWCSVNFVQSSTGKAVQDRGGICQQCLSTAARLPSRWLVSLNRIKSTCIRSSFPTCIQSVADSSNLPSAIVESEKLSTIGLWPVPSFAASSAPPPEADPDVEAVARSAALE